jgi:hypothetical protein
MFDKDKYQGERILQINEHRPEISELYHAQGFSIEIKNRFVSAEYAHVEETQQFQFDSRNNQFLS